MKSRTVTWKCLIVLCLLLTCCARRTSAIPAAPKTVRDYFVLLPQIYFDIPRNMRTSWLARAGAIVDIKNGYLLFPDDGAQATLEVALFRYKGRVTVAVYDKAAEGSLDFLRYIHRHWKNVTKEVMPVVFHGDYEYKLPRYGTRIQVSYNKFNDETLKRASRMGKRVYDLVWSQGRFVIDRKILRKRSAHHGTD